MILRTEEKYLFMRETFDVQKKGQEPVARPSKVCVFRQK